MARLLVTHPYHLALDPREHALMKPFPPLSTLVCVGQLRRAGHDVTFHDRTFEPDTRSFARALKGHEGVLILGDDHAIPMKMCLRAVSEAHRSMAAMARSVGARVLVSGADVSDHPAEYLTDGIDAVVGDPSEAVVEWADQKEGVQGVHGSRGSGGRRPNPQSLDALSDPAWDAIDLEPYRTAWRARHGRWELNVYTGRGCPYRCNWCAKPTWGRSYAVRSSARVAAEIDLLARTVQPDRIAFVDDIFALRTSWLREFRDAHKARLPFRCLSRADLLVVPGFADDLRESGCDEVWLGAESGSNAVLEAMDKDCTTEEIAQAVTLAHGAGLRVGLFLQLGYPGETHDEVLATVRMVEQLRPDDIGVSVSYPLPGTVFHDRVATTMKGRNWEGSMDNTPLFQTRYGERYYAWARALLRSTRSGQAWRAGLRELARRPGPKPARTAAGALYHRARLPLLRLGLRWNARPQTVAR